MKTTKTLITLFLVLTMTLLSACTDSSDAANSKSHSTSLKSVKNTNHKRGTDSDSSGVGNTSSKSKSQGMTKKTNSNSSNNGDSTDSQNMIDERTNAVIHATLKVESQKPNTTVDYKTKTMTQSGKKVGFSIIPDLDHQNDFKQGVIKEIINNGDETHEVTLFEYKIVNHKLSLIDPFDSKVAYTEKMD